MSELNKHDKEMSEETQAIRARRLVWAVRISTVVMAVLLAIFFFVILRNTAIINEKVEYIKDAQHPISVAAGHIETDLVYLQILFESEELYQLNIEDSQKSDQENSLRDAIADLNTQLDVVKESAEPDDTDVQKMEQLLEVLENRSNVFASMCWHVEDAEISQDEIASYAAANIDPVIDEALSINSAAIDSTTSQIEATYEDVNSSVSMLLAFSAIMLIAVLIVAIVIMVVLNVSRRFDIKLRDSLTQALQAANDANQAKSYFLANMSHDIRTPMNAIVGLTQIAVENIDDPVRVKQCLTRITTASQHLLSLINDALDMNKIESGRVTLQEEVFSLTYLAGEIEALFDSQPNSKKRKSEVVVQNLYADLLVGDVMRMRQILLNLVSNALKYTNEGDITRLVVNEQPTDSDEVANVVFIVEDSGIGMKEEFIQHIFEPFERENNEFTLFTEGTGLGMAITKNLVDFMGGTIKVESELGIGTKVSVSIDFQIADLAADVRVAEKAFFEGIENVHKKPNKLNVSGSVLVVEDNEINMEIAQQLINSRGARVDGAIDGIEAVTKVSDSPDGTYDLIFMDLQMPHMNGIEATKAIRKFLDEHGRKQIPIIAMTANAFDSDEETAIDAGMSGFMAKPINIRQLEVTLKKYLT